MHRKPSSGAGSHESKQLVNKAASPAPQRASQMSTHATDPRKHRPKHRPCSSRMRSSPTGRSGLLINPHAMSLSLTPSSMKRSSLICVADRSSVGSAMLLASPIASGVEASPSLVFPPSVSFDESMDCELLCELLQPYRAKHSNKTYRADMGKSRFSAGCAPALVFLSQDRAQNGSGLRFISSAP